ncbi:MAG: toll/interleukin-1 receptor domain-containing protein [Gammaproteobacteria bacterium]|nr:toll/interleukin-1 receptor domain-containing protein [Gammaproteobacteria bacterium]
MKDSTSKNFKYWAFISYSHKDEKWARWLHKKLETYGGHKKLVGTINLYGEPVPKRVFPIFRDRDELPGASDLGLQLQQALQQSRFLIVICSPHAAQSKYVNEEIRFFKSLKKEKYVLSLIVDGEPHASEYPDSDQQECFLRHSSMH